jgi:hypothetical protein
MSAVMRNFRRYQLRKASTEAVAREVFNTIPLVLKPSEKWILKRLARRLDACAQTQIIRLVNVPGEPTKLLTGNKRACRIRALCMQCEYKRALTESSEVAALLPFVWQIEPQARALFLTTTTRNRPLTDQDLSAMLRDHVAGIRRLFDLKRVRDVTLGHYTAIEIAIREHNGKKFAGVHAHSMLIVKESVYFDGDRSAIPQSEWRDLWRAAAKLSYPPIVDVRVARAPDGSTGLASAQHVARELVKYLVKVQSLFPKRAGRIEADPEVALAIIRCLRRQRLRRFDRIFMEAKKLKKAEIKRKAAANAEAWDAEKEADFYRNIFEEPQS